MSSKQREENDGNEAKKKAVLLWRIAALCFAALTTFLGATVLFSPMLLIAGCAYLGGRYFGDKDDKLTGDGITATATYYDAKYDQLGSLLQGTSDNKTNRSSSQRNDSAKCTLYYRFVAQDGQVIQGSVNRPYASLEDAKTEIGREFEVIYSADDPTVYETAAGHTESQADAMSGIAFAFVGIWAVSTIGFTCVATYRMLEPKSRRKKRKKKSQQKQKQQKPA